ncbi:MAG: hypothetical protein ACPLSK_06825, partial [bacterium]
ATARLDYRAEDMSFEGSMKAPREPGYYLVSLHLSGHSLMGEKYTAEPPLEIPIIIRYSLFSFLRIYWWLIAIFLLFCFGLWRIKIYRQPDLVGRLQWTYIPAGAGQQTQGGAYLRGKKMRIGRGKKDDITPVSHWPATTWCILQAERRKEKIVVVAKYAPDLQAQPLNWLTVELENEQSFHIRNGEEEIIFSYYEY